jgi:hypothetical protein
LTHTAIINNIEITKLLLEHGAEIDVIDGAGRSALFHAVFWGHAKIARLLLSKGANPNIIDRSYKAPLDFAIANNNAEICSYLIEGGATIPEGSLEIYAQMLQTIPINYLDRIAISTALREDKTDFNFTMQTTVKRFGLGAEIVIAAMLPENDERRNFIIANYSQRSDVLQKIFVLTNLKKLLSKECTKQGYANPDLEANAILVGFALNAEKYSFNEKAIEQSFDIYRNLALTARRGDKALSPPMKNKIAEQWLDRNISAQLNTDQISALLNALHNFFEVRISQVPAIAEGKMDDEAERKEEVGQPSATVESVTARPLQDDQAKGAHI